MFLRGLFGTNADPHLQVMILCIIGSFLTGFDAGRGSQFASHLQGVATFICQGLGRIFF